MTFVLEKQNNRISPHMPWRPWQLRNYLLDPPFRCNGASYYHYHHQLYNKNDHYYYYYIVYVAHIVMFNSQVKIHAPTFHIWTDLILMSTCIHTIAIIKRWLAVPAWNSLFSSVWQKWWWRCHKFTAVDKPLVIVGHCSWEKYFRSNKYSVH